MDGGTKTDCPNAGFTSIQAAVTAAAAGDTISICPGTYVEGSGGTGTNGITVNKALTIKGVGQNENGLAVGALSQLGAGNLFTFTLSGNLIDRYDKGGVLIDSGAPGGAPSGSRVTAAIPNNLIRGAGSSDTPQGQNEIQISRGAVGNITGNTITANKADAPSPQDSDGILIYHEGSAPIYSLNTIHGNNIYSNGFGLLATENFANDPPSAGSSISATGNYWGSFDGPSPVTVATTPPPSPPMGDYVNLATEGVDSSGFALRPFAQGTLPVPEPDAAPTAAITSPADGTTVTPDVATTINATAADDVGVKSVVFRKGATVLPTSGTGPTDSATYTPSAAEAGTSQVITVTATDSKGQTTTSAISPKVAGPAPPTPDLRPNVAFTAPASGASINPSGATTVSANATDDRGVASVTFLAGDRVICTDTTAPCSCQWQPNGADVGRTTLTAVGRTTLTAVVTDTAGQTSADIRTVRVQRFNASSLSSRTSPARDKRARAAAWPATAGFGSVRGSSATRW